MFIGERKAIYPGYLVRKSEETEIRVDPKVAKYMQEKEVESNGKGK